jgi:protein arginine N-methyltransferase 6
VFYTAPLHGFAFWFDVEFNVPTISPTSVTESHQVNGSLRKKRTNPSEALVLSTAPEDPPTHWQQVQLLSFYFLFPISKGSSSFIVQ